MYVRIHVEFEWKARTRGGERRQSHKWTMEAPQSRECQIIPRLDDLSYDIEKAQVGIRGARKPKKQGQMAKYLSLRPRQWQI